MDNEVFKTLLLFKGADTDGQPIFDEYKVYKRWTKRPEGNAITDEMAAKYLKSNPFDYPDFLNGKPTGQYAVPETLAKFGLKNKVNIETNKPSKGSSKESTLANDFK